MKERFNKIFSKKVRLISLVILLFIGPVRSFGGGDSNEYSVKAMFVLNFMKYVEWPSKNKSDVFRIGIAGESDLFNELETMTKNRSEFVKIKIERVSLNVIENIQILIVPKNEKNNIEAWTKKYQGKEVLIISEECKDVNNSAINLKNINNKIRFEINNTQAKLGGVKISSRLSNLAISVQP
ncbi:MAG: YfiR family protein [bacterium]